MFSRKVRDKMQFTLILAANAPDHLVLQAAEIVSNQWGGSISARRAHILQKNYSWIYVQFHTETADKSDHQTIGHVRLSPGVSTTNDKIGSAPTGVVTSVVVNPSVRKAGHGLKMMQLMEAEAIKLGYYQLFLWTDDAMEFYGKLGYSKCEQRRAVSSMVSAFEQLNQSSLSKIERLLSQKLERTTCTYTSEITNEIDSRTVAVADTSGSVPTDKITGLTNAAKSERKENSGKYNPNKVEVTTWMKKRIQDEVPLEFVSHLEMLESIARSLLGPGVVIPKQPRPQSFDGDRVVNCNLPIGSEKSAIYCRSYLHLSAVVDTSLLGLHWSHQVGPSCGIQALRMAKSHLQDSYSSSTDLPGDSETISPSLLSTAISRKYSTDGEIFNINHICALADSIKPSGADGLKIKSFVHKIDPSEKGAAKLCNLLLGQDNDHHPCLLSSLSHAPSTSTDASIETAAAAAAAAAAEAAPLPPPALIIFPYDRNDTQSTPCSKAGAAAHYALIIGFILLPSSPSLGEATKPLADSLLSVKDIAVAACGEDSGLLHDYIPISSSGCNSSFSYTYSSTSGLAMEVNIIGSNNSIGTAISPDIDPSRVLFVGMHGLSRKPIVAPYNDWTVSNLQLHCSGVKVSGDGDETNSTASIGGGGTGSEAKAMSVDASPSLLGNCAILRLECAK